MLGDDPASVLLRQCLAVKGGEDRRRQRLAAILKGAQAAQLTEMAGKLGVKARRPRRRKRT